MSAARQHAPPGPEARTEANKPRLKVVANPPEP